jgi:hypothetical protein
MVYQSNYIPHNPQLNLTTLPNNFASLTFNAVENTTAFAFPLAEALFDLDVIRLHLECVWPVSGEHCPLPRVLYYGCLAPIPPP